MFSRSQGVVRGEREHYGKTGEGHGFHIGGEVGRLRVCGRVSCLVEELCGGGISKLSCASFG